MAASNVEQIACCFPYELGRFLARCRGARELGVEVRETRAVLIWQNGEKGWRVTRRER